MTRYWDNLGRHVGGAGMDEIWLSNPAVRAAANRLISGDPALWPTDWIRGFLSELLPFERAVSIGCGTGAFERDLVHKNIVSNIVGVDVAGEAIRRAADLASQSGLSGNISYAASDAAEFLSATPGAFDAVFFHSSLHHFDDPAAILEIVRGALKPGGILYLDEYVGPSRDRWSRLKLIPANVGYYLLPRRVRRPRLVRAPINIEDPTEAAASDKIISAVRQNFEIIAKRDYGGNLLSVIYPNMHRPTERTLTQPEFDRAVRRLLFLERQLLRVPGVSSYFTVMVGRRG